MKTKKQYLLLYILVLIGLFIWGGITDGSYDEINGPWLLATLWFFLYPIGLVIHLIIRKFSKKNDEVNK